MWLGNYPYLIRSYCCCRLMNRIAHPWDAWMQYHADALTHWGQVTHICVSEPGHYCFVKWFEPVRRRAITRKNDNLFSVGPLETRFCEIIIKIQKPLSKKAHSKTRKRNWKCHPQSVGQRVPASVCCWGRDEDGGNLVDENFNNDVFEWKHQLSRKLI